MKTPALRDCPDYPQCRCERECLRLRSKPPNSKVRELAHKLIGTTGDGEVQDVLNNLERWEFRQLDTMAFACSGCDWWFAVTERREVNDLWYCTACAKERTK